MKVFKGNAKNIKDTIVGSVTKENLPFYKRKNRIYIAKNHHDIKTGYLCTLINKSIANESKKTRKSIVFDFSESLEEELNDGDILLINSQGEVAKIWDVKSNHNSILITEECNCRCIMCPQPPKKDPPELININKKILKLLNPESTKKVCITGGEPLLKKDNLFEILALCKKMFPEIAITLLTNGTYFKDFDVTKDIYQFCFKNSQFCISLHADSDDLHEKITRLKGSFRDTVFGIYNLAKFRQHIEIRFVITKLNYKRLVPFSLFIYRNFPFVVHVAFMALEISGLAEKNLDKIWIDPTKYNSILNEAVLELRRRKMNVSIYNIPLCLIDKSLWGTARRSISDWKNIYKNECKECIVQSECCGFFSTSKFHSEQTHAIKSLTK